MQYLCFKFAMQCTEFLVYNAVQPIYVSFMSIAVQQYRHEIILIYKVSSRRNFSDIMNSIWKVIVRLGKGSSSANQQTGPLIFTPPTHYSCLVDYWWTKMDSDTSNPPTIHITSFSLVDQRTPTTNLLEKSTNLPSMNF